MFSQVKNEVGASYTVFAFWCKRGLACMCLEPFTPSRKYGAEFSERSEIRFRKSVDFRKTTDLFIIIQNNQDTKISYLMKVFRKSEFLINY